jgi:3-oxoacyl-[acyl-carrier-protein] synthase II
MSEKRIVITGLGPLTSIGVGKDPLWNSLIEGKTNVRLEESHVRGELWEKFYLHRIDNFNIRNFGIDNEAIEAIKGWKEGEEIIDLYYLLAAVKLALDDSKLEYNSEKNNIGCVITHENAGLEHYISKGIDISFDEIEKKSTISKRKFSEKYHYGLIKSSYDMQTFMVMFHILKTFQIHGYSLFINNACASGLYAIESASQIIRAGRCPAVIIASADYPRVYKYLWFKDLNMYAQDGKVKPFSKDADGFVFGDGAAGLVLEDLKHAQKRNAKIYGEYLGGGFSQEGWKVTYPNPIDDFYQKAIEEALSFSKVSKEEIELLCAHGVGNKLIDRYEAKAITDVFGPNPKKPLITAFKPYIGHNLGGSNLLEIIILLLCLENNLALPVLNVEETPPRMKMDVLKKKTKIELKTVLKICCAFAGYNGAAVFRKIA